MPPRPPIPPQFVNNPGSDRILVRITDVISGTPSAYAAEEWWTTSVTDGQPDGTGPWGAMVGGTQITEDNPGVCVPASDDSEIMLAEGDFAWARQAQGQAGLRWELVPLSVTESAYRTIQEEGSDLPQRPKLNFIGASVTAADDSGNNRTNVTITAPVAFGCGWVAGLTSTDCLELIVLAKAGRCSGIDDTQRLTLAYDTGVWESTSDFTHDTGSGAAVFSITSDGVPKLTIDGVAGVFNSCGEWPDGRPYIDFKFGGTTLCDGTALGCGSNTFTVRVSCGICQPCCPDKSMPETLYLTVTSTACPALDRVVTLTRSYFDIPTYGTQYPMWYSPTGNGKWWVLECVSGAWYWLSITNYDPTLPSPGGFVMCTTLPTLRNGGGIAEWFGVLKGRVAPHPRLAKPRRDLSPQSRGEVGCLACS